jgi:hypothetical protein
MVKYYSFAKNWKNLNDSEKEDFKDFVCSKNKYLFEKKNELKLYTVDEWYMSRYIDIYIFIYKRRGLVHLKIDKNDIISCAGNEYTNNINHECDEYCWI